VLHIATVHYKSPRWVEVQTRFLKRHLGEPFETWTSLRHIDPAYGRYFDHVVEQRGGHAEKLNHLALEISHRAADDDLIMFLDGDAFPIADPMPLVRDALSRAALVAVRRAENVNEPQPHPCFCATTVGTWRTLPGDWSRGHVWPEVDGRLVSDVGANLLRALELTETPWVEVLRSNGTELNQLFFAIYGDVIYHHGAGFRESSVVSRSDRGQAPEALGLPRIPVAGRVVHRLNRSRRRAWREEKEEQNRGQSDAIFERIAADEPGWLDYVRRAQGAAPKTGTKAGAGSR
jgi:hypothetical protein